MKNPRYVILVWRSMINVLTVYENNVINDTELEAPINCKAYHYAQGVADGLKMASYRVEIMRMSTDSID